MVDMETDKPATIKCVYCDAPLVLFSEQHDAYVDGEGFDRCPDGGFHRPVLTVADIAQLEAEDAEGRNEHFDLMDGAFDRG